MDEEQVESLARESGWKPEEEWDGKPPKGGFKTADEFLEDSKLIFPAIKKDNQKLREELKTMKATVTELQGTAAEFRQMSQRQIANERAENERRKAELESIRAQAISESDGERAVAAERELAAIQTAPQPEQPQLNAQQTQLINEFVAQNSWYESDPVMRNWADGYARQLREQGALPGQPIFAAVAEEARRVFPDRMASTSTGNARPGAVETGGTNGGDYGRKTFDDLPSDAQDAYHRFKKLMPEMSKKEYLASYEWE